MAQGRKTSSSSRGRSNSGKRTSQRGGSNSKKNNERFSDELSGEIIMIGIVLVAILLFLCNFKILGAVGNAVSNFTFGLFGLPNYIIPILVSYIIFICMVNNNSGKAIRVSVSLFMIYLVVALFCEMFLGDNMPSTEQSYNDVFRILYDYSAEHHTGGGVLGGSLAFLLIKALGKVGTVLLSLAVLIICIVLITEKSFFSGVRRVSEESGKMLRNGADTAYNRYEERQIRNREYRESRDLRNKEREELRHQREEERRKKEEEREALKAAASDEKIIREVSGVPTYNFVSEEEVKKERDDIHEINLTNQEDEYNNRKVEINFHGFNEEIPDSMNEITMPSSYDEPSDDLYNSDTYEEEPLFNTNSFEDNHEIRFSGNIEDDFDAPKPVKKVTSTSSASASSSGSIFAAPGHEPTNGGRTFGTNSGTASELAPKTVSARKPKPFKPYVPPKIEFLNKGPQAKAGNKTELTNTANKLEEVLESFGVKVKVSDISQGPTVTRYELIPETGTKVSKILSLQDDLKLNLAATDIRIEAPIPGKSAIGIEVPNKEKSMVALRDLLETPEFKKAESKLSFAVGKDLSGGVIIGDIAKMPHVLIAGATGAGKSVCINTLIMSILYKARPDEVKFIMIDPKVVELSVYNHIPHLLIPVVTEPVKANNALAWAVHEMDDRYKKFAEYSVRDIKGYNEKIKDEVDVNGEPIPPMYQLVVIVDELADLMMVAGKEVEASICRLAQLARACGIHLVIATQRPSVNVITGLIKANMPSRIAFAVTSGVDSRTILDSVGAEKLLGNGDMLYLPKGKNKPDRIQGAFVSDEEVNQVVDYLKQYENMSPASSTNIEESINNMQTQKDSGDVLGGVTSSDDDMDEFFIEAGRLIIETNKCSAGMLQRKFKIGFNRASRIMDSLSEAGVVGPENGTKPRTILMNAEEFENYINTL